jgi:hypothetical protein
LSQQTALYTQDVIRLAGQGDYQSQGFIYILVYNNNLIQF